jgi:hypothetical protein
MTAARLFDVNIRSSIISKLTSGKTAYIEHLTAEYLIISCKLHKLLNWMLRTGKYCYTVPVPKIED